MSGRWRRDPHLRPAALLAACILVLALVDRGQGRFLSTATAFTTFESFATGGLVALGLGLAMMIREFDLSVVGMFSLAGCIAVLTGGTDPWLGLACATAAGLAAGLVQGLIITRFRLGSVGVTLGGLLVFSGMAYVLTDSRSLGYDNLDVALRLTAPIAAVFSLRSLAALAIFAIAAVLMAVTRLGRDIIATGSDRRAASFAGVHVDRVVIGVFTLSGVCAALSGALLSYSLASASPAGLAAVIVPAAAAAIIGGVSLGGGSGRPLGIAAGVLVLAVLRSGFNAIGAPPFVNDVAMGAILLTVAILDGPYLMRRLAFLTRRRAPLPQAGKESV